MNQALFSIIIVNWNGRELLRSCLQSIPSANPNAKYEIIVVDNASSDDSADMVRQEFPTVVLIENTENLGFSKATNLGVKLSQGKVILLLNSDAELKSPGTFEQIEQFFTIHEDVGILGVNLIFPDGVPQSPGGNFISNWQLFQSQVLFLSSPLFFRLKNKLLPGKNREFYDIDYVSGACMFLRRKVIEDIGFLNENFYMYGEDMEFCYRAKQQGWRRTILTTVEAIHLKGQSTKKNVDNVLFLGIKNNCSLINKFYGNKSALIAHNIYMIGLCFRFILSLFRQDIKPSQYLKIIVSNSKYCISKT
jgi:GT2 family glycosyltransferase